jgi:transposase
MEKLILVGCDLHDKSMLLKFALGTAPAGKRSFQTNAAGVKALIGELKKRAAAAGGAQIVVAYEASGAGFRLHDELSAQGFICHVLAPSKMAATPKQRHSKTDEKDAEKILEVLRGHYLAGNKLPEVWIPGHQTRDDRELVRCRLDAQEKCSAVKIQIVSLLKRHGVTKADDMGDNWTKGHRAWLAKLAGCSQPLGAGTRAHLGSLLRQLKSLETEVKKLDGALEKLAKSEHLAVPMKALTKIPAVGLVTALVFLTELGDPTRFKNRRQLGAYLGLAPSSYESGEHSDRKGHITHQGPARVRYVLNQAVWNRLRCDPHEQLVYERIAARNPKHKKIAVVAGMRRLGVRMWHAAVTAQEAA